MPMKKPNNGIKPNDQQLGNLVVEKFLWITQVLAINLLFKRAMSGGMGGNSNKKHSVLETLFLECMEREDMRFDNAAVKRVSEEKNFSNQFDVTKIDSSEKLPKLLQEKDYGVLHLGGGRHAFIKGIKKLYHEFEPINQLVEWRYQKSLLNNFNTSESNLLAVANNQRILHDFMFGTSCEFDHKNVLLRPKTYFPHRTKFIIKYHFGEQIIETSKLQIEIDLTIEYQGKVAVFEAKNGNPKTFAIYQLFNPCYYYHAARERTDINGKLKEIFGVYLVRNAKEQPYSLKLWCYQFKNPNNMGSIHLVKSAKYILIK